MTQKIDILSLLPLWPNPLPFLCAFISSLAKTQEKTSFCTMYIHLVFLFHIKSRLVQCFIKNLNVSSITRDPCQINKIQESKRSKKTPLGVNPLSWNRQLTKISAEAHLGAVHLTITSKQKVNWTAFLSEDKIGLNCVGLSKPYLNECSAEIRKDGFLYVSNPKNWAFKNMIMPGGSLHMSDFSLFYMNLRKNIEERWKAYQAFLAK